VIDIFFFYFPLHRENLKMFMYYPAGVIFFLDLFRFAINIIPRWGIYYSLLFMYYPAGVISFIILFRFAINIIPRWGIYYSLLFIYYPAAVISFLALFRFAINIIPRWGIYYSCFEFNPLKMSPRWGFLLFHTRSILPL
jgi:hypothetical protein